VHEIEIYLANGCGAFSTNRAARARSCCRLTACRALIEPTREPPDATRQPSFFRDAGENASKRYSANRFCFALKNL